MALSSGEQLGHYKIVSMIGKGGMGEVYLGTDTRLGRSVAIKVSSREFNDRFEREAHAISTLNHPNICTLHDVGPNYLVMEYIEGETLSKIIERGPLPLDKALAYAVQIVDALAAAHAKGVIHRDLKPGNIIITKNGAKVLDFGLAKVSTEKISPESAASIQTVTEPITRAGAILGTLYYMAPEQVEGKDTDERSDIFSFGVVLYEMITGQRPFTGDTQAAVLAALLKDQTPPMSQRQPATPRALERVVRKCLEKKPDDRWQSARDLKPTLELIDLDTPPPDSASASVPIPIQISPEKPKSKPWLWPAVVAAGVIAAGAALAMWAPWKKSAPAQAVRFEVGPANKMTFIAQAAMAVSPDGRWMVFPASGEDGKTRYYIRSLDGVEVRAIAEANQSPAAWSSDSRWVLFADGTKLKKVDIQGGPPQILSDFPSSRLGGAGWNSDGVIIAGASGAGPSSILRVPASGGQVTPITVIAPGETVHLWPQFLPDGKHFLYLRASNDSAKTGVYIGSLDVKPEQQNMQRLLATDRQAYYASEPGGGPGHLIFMRGATLMAQPFDPAKMILSGEPAAIADGVDSYSGSYHGLFSVSDTGTLVYRGGTGAAASCCFTALDRRRARTCGRCRFLANPSPPGVTLDVNAATVAHDGKSVIVVLHEDALHRVVSIPLKGSLSGKFAPRTLFTTTINTIWFVDTDSDGRVYISATDRHGEAIRYSATPSSPNTTGPKTTGVEAITGHINVDGERIVSLPDGRAIVTMRGLGRDRLMALADGKNPAPLVSTAEETSEPMTAAGPSEIAFMLGPPPHTTIGVADTATGRVKNKIPTAKGEISSIASSPDGKTLYFSAGGMTGGKIWSVPSAGGEPSLIRSGDGVIADPSGGSLVVSTVESAKARLFRVPLDGSAEHEIATDGSVPLAPVSHGLLSADGRLLVVLAPLDSWFWVPGILDTNTGRITRLPTDQASHTRALNWTPDGQIVEARESVRSTLWRFQRVGNR